MSRSDRPIHNLFRSGTLTIPCGLTPDFVPSHSDPRLDPESVNINGGAIAHPAIELGSRGGGT